MHSYALPRAGLSVLSYQRHTLYSRTFKGDIFESSRVAQDLTRDHIYRIGCKVLPLHEHKVTLRLTSLNIYILWLCYAEFGVVHEIIFFASIDSILYRLCDNI